MKAYIDLDSGEFKSPIELPGFSDGDIVSVGRVKSESFPNSMTGDILSFLNASTDPFSAYVSKPTGLVLPSSCGPNQIVCPGVLQTGSDKLVECVQKLSMRACVARSIDSRGVVDCSVVLAPAYFWERLFMIHVRWSRNRMAEFDKNYHSMIINFCASLYEYETVFVS